MNELTGFGPIANQAGLAELGIASAVIVLIIVLWTLVWKGLALWTAARNKHRWWFIVMLVLNTLGILEIIYYFFFRDKESIGQKMVDDHFPQEEDPKKAL